MKKLIFSDQSSDDEEYQDKGDVAVDSDGDDDDDEDEDMDMDSVQPNMSWKENLAQKARTAYLERQSNTQNLMKIVYGCFSAVSS